MAVFAHAQHAEASREQGLPSSRALITIGAGKTLAGACAHAVEAATAGTALLQCPQAGLFIAVVLPQPGLIQTGIEQAPRATKC